MHAVTVGVLGINTLGMMSRVTLGHTGRPRVATRGLAFAFAAISGAAAVRVFGPSVLPGSTMAMLHLSGALWTAAFAVFLWEHGSMWLRRRPDGAPG